MEMHLHHFALNDVIWCDIDCDLDLKVSEEVDGGGGGGGGGRGKRGMEQRKDLDQYLTSGTYQL